MDHGRGRYRQVLTGHLGDGDLVDDPRLAGVPWVGAHVSDGFVTSMLRTRDPSPWTKVRNAVPSESAFCCEPCSDLSGVALYHPGRGYRYRCRRPHRGRATRRKHAETLFIFAGVVDRIHLIHRPMGEAQPQSRPSGPRSRDKIPVPLPSTLNEGLAIHHGIFGVQRSIGLRATGDGRVHWKHRCTPLGPGLAG